MVGVVHDVVNIPSLRQAVARGEIFPRLGPQLVANVAFGGLALSLFGVVIILITPDIAKGRRTAWRIAVLIGLFFVLSGVAAYWWLPRARVLYFSAVGALLCGPLLMWRKEFLVE